MKYIKKLIIKILKFITEERDPEEAMIETNLNEKNKN